MHLKLDRGGHIYNWDMWAFKKCANYIENYGSRLFTLNRGYNFAYASSPNLEFKV